MGTYLAHKGSAIDTGPNHDLLSITKKAALVSLSADTSGFHILFGPILRKHSIPPEGFQYTTFSNSPTINEKNECRQSKYCFLIAYIHRNVNNSNAVLASNVVPNGN